MAPQDSFIVDEDEETCPLCVEELDLTDRNFRPCPCGYQVCQFCFNNIKVNLNGLCPACRRPYDDKTIEFKVVTPEELAQFKANVQKNAKKKAEQRQKEAQKREVESLNRKHLSGLRVIQKNLVYVVGLSPGIREDEILNTLRGEKYFGQYGKIIKIVVSKAKSGEVSQNGQPSLGVYVTFAKKEDAARCIAAVNGSQNGDRVLRAQLGTTKYCSAYLRGENCTNKQCMFLHEPGENEDSYSRQDLSSINSVNTQRPLASSASSSRQAALAQTSIQQAQPIAPVAQPMARDTSKDGSDSGDGSALPSSASWARGGTQQRSRRGSHATSGAASSPAVSQAMPATAEEGSELAPESEAPEISNLVAVVEPAPEVTRPVRDPVLMQLLKSINSPLVTLPSLSTAGENADAYAAYPPLFDDRGGEKRKAMREQQEEARLHLEQESQADLRSVAETAEEEEPESGSLQLGGEPEDRDTGREGNLHQGFQRRASTQLPIHRDSNSGSFGSVLGHNFSQNISNLTSINGRALTPQQQQHIQLLKSSQAQSGFVDQFPPGMGGLGQSSSLFQQQGHNRQSSRFSFANDSSSTTVKPSANPKFLAQQSSMMPSASHTQQGNQFYGSSMPGPPPGLKSSGTPPIGFGQNHSFGSSMGGSSLFGSAAKDNDMFRDMLRGRGSAGGNQVHDAGKRELMFPSFLSQQYPSASSTPAPASGLLASLYGPQTGAFHDFGQKQKKKGKKHRHANTSSSGGSGLVDLADPSILQARMQQHQQQSNAGVGHGLFGSQAQVDQDLPSLDAASLEVDALVADNLTDDISGYRPFAAFDRISRSSTPSVPPGFGIANTHAHPLASNQNESIVATKTASRIVPTSAPFTPSRYIARAASPLTDVSVPTTPTQSVVKSKGSEKSKLQAKEDVKALANNTGLSMTIASQSSVAHKALQSEDFPALENTKAKTALTPVAAKIPTHSKVAPTAASNKKAASSSSSTSVVSSALKGNEKRQTAANLNISVPSKPASKLIGVPETQAKSNAAPSAFPPLPTSTSAIQPQLARNAPKTLRLIPTPKLETPTAASATPSSTTSMFPQNFTPSRQASIASNSRFEHPDTPTSEVISDNASITSASMSRASSPPPTKVGSAPVRATTKSMQKKNRRDAQKEKEKLELETAAKPEPEPEIGPIMGRKKKQKKEKTVHSAAGGSTPTVSRPSTPVLAEPVSEEPNPLAETTEHPAQASESSALDEKETQKSTNKSQDPKGKGKAKVQQPPTSEQVSAMSEHEDEDTTERPIPTPAVVFQELVSAGILGELSSLNILKQNSFNFRSQDLPVDMQNINPKLSISAEDRADLLAGKPVFKNGEGGSRIMLSPNGDCVRNLSPEEEQRYLEIQARIAGEAGPAAFFSSKHHANSGFTLIGGRAVPNGPPPFFPFPNIGATPMDPVSKIQRDEALSYINQFVLPSLSANSQLEKALNANALDAEMLRSSEASTWASWGSDQAVSHPENGESPYGTHHEGILATGLESMTAHFAIGKDIDRGQPLGNVSLLSLSEAETAMQIAKKESENLEKRFNAILKKNRRLLLGTGH